MKFATKEPEVGARATSRSISPRTWATRAARSSAAHEAEELNEVRLWPATSRRSSGSASWPPKASGCCPDFGVKFHFWGLGGDMKFGGSTLGRGRCLTPPTSRLAVGDHYVLRGGQRRQDRLLCPPRADWAFQSNLAAGEITQIFKQLRAAQIREAIAEAGAEEPPAADEACRGDRALPERRRHTNKKGKKTNKALYAWMKREVKGLYCQCFQFAFDIAKKAERALQHELGDPS